MFFSNNEKILKILLDNNIDINAQDSMGQTVMHYCAKYDKYAFMSIIMTYPIQKRFKSQCEYLLEFSRLIYYTNDDT